jgi:glutamine synthetase
VEDRRNPCACQLLLLVPLQGVANRGASVRVGRETEQNGKGYFEDRRPASNMDPYVVTSMIAETTIVWKP